ncbi:glucosyltransferase domain-containing protein [Pseudescherichia sp.]|uniref:glucosyltransferase domain-containing protein n=1 Tax=Pseudescherichia sp. TaxID=2055881 RepID=UPI0028A7DC81|nr:glucosyltransferase domain-containing protein [Pseudescherichia sp.]
MFKNIDFDYKLFNAFLILGVIFVLPIIIADYYYIDDLGRSIVGYSGWSSDGRPVADMVMETLGFGLPLTDISPIPLILSIATLSLSCTLLAKSAGFKSKTAAVISLFPIIANPFFLSNLSYKFDSLTMSLAVLFSCIPFTFRCMKAFSNVVLTTACIITSLCLYQAASNAFVILAVSFFLLESCKNKGCIQAIILNAASFAIAYAIYLKIIVPHYVVGEYSTGHSDVLPLSLDSLDSIANNTGMSVNLIKSFMAGYAGTMFLLLFTVSVVCIIVIAICSFINSKNIKGLLISLIAISSPAIFFLSIPGVVLALKNPVLMPRVYIGFGFAIAASMSIIYFTLCRFFKPLVLVMAVPVMFLFSFGATYGNSLKAQKEFDAFVLSNISSDINRLGLSGKKYIVVDGYMPKSPVTMLAYKKYPLVEMMTPGYLADGWVWGNSLMHHYLITQTFPDQAKQEQIRRERCTLKPLTENNIYKIMSFDDYIVLSFVKTC